MIQILTLLIAYIRGMSSYDAHKANLPTVEGRLNAFTDEFRELLEAIRDCDLREAVAEYFDVVHTLCRLVQVLLPSFCSIPVLVVTYFLAMPTAMKHARRYIDHGCIRNLPHCNSGNHGCSTGG